jgi:hypothetical protein
MSADFDRYRIVACDDSSNLILAVAPSLASANALAKAMVNVLTCTLPVQLPRRHAAYAKFDFERDHLQVDRELNIRVAPEHLITPSYRQRRDEARLRLTFLYALEVWAQQPIARLCDYFDTTLDPLLLDELQHCGADNASYSACVREYAEIQDIPADTAYQELNMKARASVAIRMRNYALYQRGVNRLNAARSKVELEAALATTIEDFYGKSRA